MTKKKSAYKIRDTLTGLYSAGGQSSSRPCNSEVIDCSTGKSVRVFRCEPNGWNENGKIWNGSGPLKNHLNQFSSIPDTWEVVEFELVEIQKKVVNANIFAGTAEKLARQKELERIYEEEKKEAQRIKAEALKKLTPEEISILGIKRLY